MTEMCETICSISSYIELLGLLKYLFLAWGAYFALSAINCFSKQRCVMRAVEIASPQLQKMVRSGEMKLPPYKLHGIFHCTLVILSILAAMALPR